MEKGKAPSRAMANPILEVTVKLQNPAKNKLPINNAISI